MDKQGVELQFAHDLRAAPPTPERSVSPHKYPRTAEYRDHSASCTIYELAYGNPASIESGTGRRGMTEENFGENPAIDPTRTWLRDASTVMEAHLLIQGLSSRERDVLVEIVENGGQLAASGSTDVSRAAARINSFCEAFGFVDLLESRDGMIRLTTGARPTVRDALDLGSR
jgi:hypothetical protein